MHNRKKQKQRLSIDKIQETIKLLRRTGFVWRNSLMC